MFSDKKILVSHPGKQHVHHLLTALQRNGYKYRFVTSFWYNPGNPIYKVLNLLPSGLRKKAEKELGKRTSSQINSSFISLIWFPEVLRKLSSLIQTGKSAAKVFLRDRRFDAAVSKKISEHEYEIIIGYEMSCYKTFSKAKSLGMTTVLDLAQIHYKEIMRMTEKYTFFSEPYDSATMNKVQDIKEKELQLADYIICLSELAKDSLIKNGIPENKIVKATLGFNPEDFKPKINYRKAGVFRIVFVGTLLKRKGIDILIKAFKELNLPEAELWLIGPTGDARDVVEENKNFIRHVSFMHHHELNACLTESDLFVLPSYLESWGMVVSEAMASGLPVIITSHTGSKDIVQNESGYIIPPGDAKALKEKISYLFNNRDVLEKMGRAARKQIEQYSWKQYYARINEIIETINLNDFQKRAG